MRDSYRHLALCLFACGLATGLQAQQLQTTAQPPPARGLPLRFEHFSVNEGLSQSTVTSIFQDHLGFMWFGTYDGLNRFDGVSFTHFKTIPSDAASLSANAYFQGDPLNPVDDDPAVFFITEDRSGHLWVGTRLGLDRFHRATETFTRFVHDPADPTSLSPGVVTSVAEDRAGRLWAGTWGGGLNRMDPERPGRFTRYRHDPADATSLSSDVVLYLFEDRTGRLWVGTADGLNRMDPAHPGRFTRYALDTGLSERMIWQRIAEDAEEAGVLWIVSTSPFVGESSLLRFDPRAGTQRRYDVEGALMIDLAADPAAPGVFWITTIGQGLYRFETRTGRYQRFHREEIGTNGLSTDRLLVLYGDRTGSLWVGTYGAGVARFDPSAGSFVHYSPDEPGVVIGVLEDRAGGLWMGSAGRLTRLDRTTGRREHWSPDQGGAFTSVTSMYTSLYEDRQGFLWMGTWTDGLSRLDRTTGRFTRFVHDPADPASVSPINYGSVVEDRSGTLWAGTSGGLARMDRTTGRFTHFTEQNSEVPANNVMGILEDDAGYLWLSTSRGISRFDPRRETFRNFDLNDGLRSMEYSGGTSAFRSPRTGAMFFGNAQGLTAFQPRHFETNVHPPPVVLTDFKLFHKSVPVGEGAPLTRHVAETEAIELRHHENAVSFTFAALHFKNAGQNQYRYRLEPYETDWIVAGPGRTATYTNLPPDRYVFRVKAANSDGVWNEAGVSLRITILPPWWRTNWAYALYGLLFAGGVFAADRLQRRRLIKKEREKALLREKELHAEAAEAWASYLQSENQRQTQELEQARTLQLSMLPRTLPEHPRVAIAAHMQTATEVGGDYYDFHRADDGTLTFAIGDATGHGLAAGTMVTAMKGLFSDHAEEDDLEEVMQRCARSLRRMHLPKLYMALAFGRLKGETLELLGAGMPPALIYRAGSGSVEAVPLKGLPLGSPGVHRYRRQCTLLGPGDTVVLMSDGLPELRNGSGEMLGYDRMPEMLAEAAARTPEEIIAHLLGAARAWGSGQAWEDDMTFLVMQVKA